VAQGEFVHVFVARDGRRPVDMPERLRAALARLARP
jgi:acyl-CoA thioester hydrolase